MVIGVTLFVLAVLVVSIWILIELKRFKHKIFAIFLIVLILFSYISASVIFKGEDIDFKTIPGLIKATKVYFSWIGSIFSNLKSITTNAIRMDWSVNETPKS
jgi:MFS superfamily sulfate permease-like transporter